MLDNAHSVKWSEIVSAHPYYDWQGNPISQEQWLRLFGDERHIGEDQIGDASVSTVWLGLDHRLLGAGPPLIFETMIFGGEHDQWQCRYATETQARDGHATVVTALRNGEDPEVVATMAGPFE